MSAEPGTREGARECLGAYAPVNVGEFGTNGRRNGPANTQDREVQRYSSDVAARPLDDSFYCRKAQATPIIEQNR